MLVVEVTLLSGRYHAHVWGEAQFGMAGPEWPPSPWRLLRALAAAWFQSDPRPCSETERDSLLEGLGRTPAPELWLPATAFRELSLYQPVVIKDAKTGVLKINHRALHFDHFAIPSGGRFFFAFDTDGHWPALDQLLAAVRYLGRSESRAFLRVVTECLTCPQGFYRAVPRERCDLSADPVFRRVLTTGPEFRTNNLWQLRNDPKSARPAGSYPQHLVDAMLKAKRTLPDGTRWVEYGVPRASFVGDIPRAAEVAHEASDETLTISEVEFRLCRRITIPLADTVRVARAFRNEALRAFRRKSPGQHSVALSGRNEDGTVSKGHRHVYYLPQPARGRGELGTLVVRVPSGEFSTSELDSLLSVTCLLRGETYPIRVVAESTRKNMATLGPSTRWLSLTPFLAPLHYRHGRDAMLPDQQLARLIADQYGVTPVRVSHSSGAGSQVSVRAHFYGRSKPSLTRRIAHRFELRFREPIHLPLPVGADAHFGLGQFVPAPETSGS